LLLAKAMLLSSPLVATVGLSLSIPLALASDVLRGRARLSGSLLLGMMLVSSGFLAVSSAEYVEAACQRSHSSSHSSSAAARITPVLHTAKGVTPLRRVSTGATELSRPSRSTHLR
jgi:solute carrier family 35 protein F5